MTEHAVGSEAPMLIVDDFALGRECLADRLGRHYADVRQAWDLPTFFRETERGMLRLILVNFATHNSANLLQVSLDLEPQPKVIVFGLADESDVVSCAEAGAVGLMLRSESFEQLVTLVHEVGNGRPHCSPEVSAMLIGQVYSAVTGRHFGDPATNTLTERETEVLLLIEQGLTNQQIASRLSVTVHTVKNHVHSLLGKLGAESRAEASRIARAMRYTGGSAAVRPQSHLVSR